MDYIFVSKDQFEEWIRAGELLEWALVYGDYKGIPKRQACLSQIAPPARISSPCACNMQHFQTSSCSRALQSSTCMAHAVHCCCFWHCCWKGGRHDVDC